MERREFGKSFSTLLLGLSLAPTFLLGKSSKNSSIANVVDEKGFNNKIGLNRYQTNPVFVLYKDKKSEVLIFDSKIEYKTLPPGRTETLLRKMDVDIIRWKGVAYSNLLKKHVSFETTKSENSYYQSLFLNQDYPALLKLNTELNIYVDDMLYCSHVAAIAKAEVGNIFPLNSRFDVECENDFMIDGANVNIKFISA